MAGVRTYAQLMDAVVLNMGNDSTLDAAAYAGRWVNAAYLDMTTKFELVGQKFPAMKHCFPELESTLSRTTTDGTAYVAKPLDVAVLKTVYDSTNDRKLSFRQYHWYLNQTGHATSTSEGEPKFWSPYGLYVYLHPTPDDAYALSLIYRRKPALLSATTDVTEIGSEWDEAIEQLATVRGFMALQDFDKAQKWKAEFLETVAGKLRLYQESELDTKEHLRPDSNYLDYEY